MRANVKSKLPEVEKAARIIRGGGIVVFPTDTVYGIGCRFDDPKAIERIAKIKKRSSRQQMPVLVSAVSQVEKIASVNPQAKNFIKKYWPGGLTIIMKKKKEDETIGIRMPDHQLTRKLIKLAGIPIVGTSANFHADPSVTSYRDLNQKLIKEVDFVLKGECPGEIESTVVDTTVTPYEIIRQGAISLP